MLCSVVLQEASAVHINREDLQRRSVKPHIEDHKFDIFSSVALKHSPAPLGPSRQNSWPLGMMNQESLMGQKLSGMKHVCVCVCTCVLIGL